MTAHMMVKCTSLCYKMLSKFCRWRTISYLLLWWERLKSEWMTHRRYNIQSYWGRSIDLFSWHWLPHTIITVGSICIFHYIEAVDWTDDERGRCVPIDTKHAEPSSCCIRNERGEHLDWEGNMEQRRDRVQILLSDIPKDVAMTASVQVSSTEARTIDNVLEGNVVSHD